MKPVKNYQGPEEGEHRVARGGAWISGAKNCRAAIRGMSTPSYRNDDLGFRIVMVPRMKKP